jgi:hypothetical protein
VIVTADKLRVRQIRAGRRNYLAQTKGAHSLTGAIVLPPAFSMISHTLSGSASVGKMCCDTQPHLSSPSYLGLPLLIWNVRSRPMPLSELRRRSRQM